MNAQRHGFEYLLVATWLGLLGGIGVVGTVVLRRDLFGSYVLVDPNLPWMAPLAGAAWLALLGLGLAFAARLLKPQLIRGLTIFVATSAAAMGILIEIPGLHPVTRLLLALGVGSQAICVLASGWERIERLARVSLFPLVGLVVLWGAGGLGVRARREYLAMRDEPAAPPGAPNILLITLDAVRARSLSMLGHDRPTTPRLEEYRRQGVSFLRAYSGASWTMPSHTAMFTGLLPSVGYTTWTEPIDSTLPTLGAVLAARGYATASIAANYSNIPAENGLDRGFAHFESYPVDLAHFFQSAPLGAALLHHVRMMIDSESVQRRDAPDINRSLLRWLDRLGRRPFFAFLNYLDAHEPYLPPPPFDTLYGPIHPRLVRDFWAARVTDTAEIQRQRNAYEGGVTYLDSQVGALLDSLAERGLLGSTIVVITADHGEQLGDHGLRGHGNSLYTEVLHVPLLIIATGRVPVGLTVSHPVSTCDIAATVLDLAGLDAALPGLSLSRSWTPPFDTVAAAVVSEADYIWFAPAWTPIARGPMVSVVRGTRHYIRNGDGREELYELSTDPREARDLAAMAEPELQAFRVLVARAKQTGRCSIQ